MFNLSLDLLTRLHKNLNIFKNILKSMLSMCCKYFLFIECKTKAIILNFKFSSMSKVIKNSKCSYTAVAVSRNKKKITLIMHLLWVRKIRSNADAIWCNKKCSHQNIKTWDWGDNFLPRAMTQCLQYCTVEKEK